MLSRTSFRRLGSGLPRRRHQTTRRRRSRLQPTCRQLRLEPLEDRTLLAGAVGDAALVADIIPGVTSSDPYGLADVNGTLYFAAGTPSGRGIYKSDGTPGGTVLLRDNASASGFIPFDGSVYFGGATSLGKTDGTSGGTVILKEGVRATLLTPVGESLFFSGENDKGQELWISDGTSQGTKMVKDVWGGNTIIKTKGDPACVKRCGGVKVLNSSRPGYLTEFNGMVFFAATTDDGRELWASDGTGKGTRMVKDLAPGEASSGPRDLVVFDESLYFGALGGLWKSDGTEAGTVLVKPFSSAGLLTELNGELFFAANDGAHGHELWKSDGTAAGTVMVSDINFGAGGSMPGALTRVGNDLYFTADDGTTGRELWKYDGATGDTSLIKDINPGPADSLDHLPQITNVNGQIYFVADAGSGFKIWQSDGTGAGTMLVPSAAGQPDYSDARWLAVMNNKLYFTAFDPIHGRELWDPPAVQSAVPLGALEEQLFVADFGKDSVFRYDADTGEFVDRFVSHGSGGLNQPYGVIFGPDANGDGQVDLYVSGGLFGATGQPRSVNRYDGLTGEFIDAFTQGGNLTSPRGIIFTPDGDLLVADRSVGDTFPLGRVARFDGATGQYEGDFVTLGSGGYALPQGLVFGPGVQNPNKMDLYASSADTNAVLRFDGETGEFLGQFVATDSGGLDHPLGLTFGPGGDLFVASTFENPIIARFQGPSGKMPGAFVETFVPAGSGGMLNPVALIFGPDGNGDGYQDLYVTNSQLQKSLQAKDGSVKRYDGQTGAFIDTIVATKSGGLDDPIGLTFRNTDSVTLEYTGPDAADDTVLIAVERIVSANNLNSLSVNDSVQIQSDGTTDPPGLPARNIANDDNTQSFMSVPTSPLSTPLPVGRSTAPQVDAAIHDESLADDWNHLFDDPLLDVLAGELVQA